MEYRYDESIKFMLFEDSNLHQIPEKIFSQFSELNALLLHKNKIQLTNVLENCQNLHDLYLDVNVLETVGETFKNCINIQYLNE